MANLTAFQSFNMLASDDYVWTPTTVTESRILTIANGGSISDEFTGSFTFPADGSVNGTMTGFKHFENGNQVFAYSGNLDAYQVYYHAIATGDTQSTYSYAFSGNDNFIGSSSNDILKGYSGDDVIDGGAGSDIAAFSGQYADYSITKNANGSIRVVDKYAYRDGTDTLSNIETLKFSDKSISADSIESFISDQFTPNVSLDQKIAALYVGFFNRAPDYNGLSYWMQQAISGAYGNDLSLLKAISAGFAQHPQFTLDYGSLDSISFVNRLYENMLGGTGDAAGIAYWKDLLDTGTSRADLVAQFINGALLVDIEAYAATNPSFSDADKASAYVKQNTLLNKTNVAISFATQLGSLTNIDQTQYSDLTQAPAYQASQQILSGITQDLSTVVSKTNYINSLLQAGNPIQSIIGTTVTTVDVHELLHESDSSISLDAGTGAYKFVFDMNKYSPMEISGVRVVTINPKTYISNFSDDDSILILNSDGLNFNPINSTEYTDIQIYGGERGGLERITLVGLTNKPNDLGDFNALSVGEITLG